jgi:poly(glycerol-phosphate) alpha-glucosyltransferase
MLDAVDLRKSRLKKWVARKLYVDPLIQGAACVRAISVSELNSIRAFGVKRPVCLVPNGVDLPQNGVCETPEWRLRLPPKAKVLFYIGRIHPKKGLRALVEAWSMVRNRESDPSHDWHLVIAGWDQDGHELSLKDQVNALRMGSSVHFIGPQFQAAKHLAFRCSEAFILPSTSEGLPTVVLEAWAYGLPAVMTPECNLPEGFSSGAAIRVETQPEQILRGLQQLFRMPETQRREMGGRGRSLVEKTFCWPSIARDILAVCNWVVGRADRPATVSVE